MSSASCLLVPNPCECKALVCFSPPSSYSSLSLVMDDRPVSQELPEEDEEEEDEVLDLYADVWTLAALSAALQDAMDLSVASINLSRAELDNSFESGDGDDEETDDGLSRCVPHSRSKSGGLMNVHSRLNAPEKGSKRHHVVERSLRRRRQPRRRRLRRRKLLTTRETTTTFTAREARKP